MELNFEQVNGAYVARVTVDGAYAVHLERSGRCPLAVLQRHGEQGQYVPCPLPSVTGTLAPAVVDVSLDHCVYPVEVEIVSGLLPQVATLTRYAGGGGGGGIPEAPADGKTYGRKDAAWAEVADAAAVADLSAAQEQQGQKLAALEEADTAQDTKIEALEGGLADVEGKVEAMPAAYTLDSSLFHITDESTSEQIRDALEASGGFEAIVEALKRGDALYLHYSGEGWDGTYTESGINLVYGYVTEDDNGTTNLCLYFTRKNNIDVYDIYHDPDDDTYSARNFDYDLSVLDSDEYPLSTLGQKYQQLEASQARQDEKIEALETAQTEQGQRLTAAEGDIAALEGRMDTAEGEIDDLQAADAQQDEKITALETADAQQDTKIEALETASAGHDEAIGELETKVEGLEAGGGFPEAPADGKTYGRRDKAWAPVPDPSADIAALEGRMDTAEGEIDALQAADTEQDGRLDALEASDTAQDGKITALEAADTALGERVSEAEGKITTAEGKITTAEGDIDALEGRVAELEEQGGGGLSDAPQDGTLYGRRDGAWVPGMDYPSDDSFPRENEVYGRGRNGWIQVQMAVNTITYEEVGSDFADIGFVGTYNFHSSYTDWTPMVFYGISAYGLQSPTEQQKLRRMFSYMIVMTKAKYYILMGGCTEATAELPVAYAVSNSGGEITITGVDVNAFPEAYRFHMVINSSGTITENTITQIQG